MKQILLILIITSNIACNNRDIKRDLIADRIDFVIDLKKRTGEKAWKEFSKKENEGPFFYLHNNKTYIFFADSLVRKHLSLNSIPNNYYSLEERYDSIPFHMEVQIEFDSIHSDPILLDHPIEFCSSPEETYNFIPSVKSTEVWATMVIHEMFHHFQFNNATFKGYMKEISELGYDSRDLQKLITSDSVFQKNIELENDFLLKILQTNNHDSIKAYINNFLNVRKIRREEYSKESIHFAEVEDIFEKMEGSARYIEYQSMLKMNEIAHSKNQFIIKNDSLFSAYQDFKNFNISDKDYAYLELVSYDYYYTLGFNLLRVLDKLQLEYQEDLLNQPEKSLTGILTEYSLSLPDSE